MTSGSTKSDTMKTVSAFTETCALKCTYHQGEPAFFSTLTSAPVTRRIFLMCSPRVCPNLLSCTAARELERLESIYRLPLIGRSVLGSWDLQTSWHRTRSAIKTSDLLSIGTAEQLQIQHPRKIFLLRTLQRGLIRLLLWLGGLGCAVRSLSPLQRLVVISTLIFGVTLPPPSWLLLSAVMLIVILARLEFSPMIIRRTVRSRQR